MSIAISQSEKLDIFLALAMYHKAEIELGDADSDQKQLDVMLRSFSSLENDELRILQERARRYEKLKPKKQKVWQAFWMEKLKGLGQTRKLDENIHLQHFAKVLTVESQSIRELIYGKLPKETQEKISDLVSDGETGADRKNKTKLPTEEVWLLIRKAFLSNFIALEDIYKRNELDSLSLDQLETFVWNIGVRETAISCRGIETKENLAVFLKPFDEQTTKEIAAKITELEDIDANRVLRSETIVQESFQTEEAFENKLINLGLQLLAIALVRRDNNAQQYTIQKLPIETSKNLAKFIEQFEIQFDFTDASKRKQFEELATEINELAVEFKESEK